jgi:hypothetical protein
MNANNFDILNMDPEEFASLDLHIPISAPDAVRIAYTVQHKIFLLALTPDNLKLYRRIRPRWYSTLPWTETGNKLEVLLLSRYEPVKALSTFYFDIFNHPDKYEFEQVNRRSLHNFTYKVSMDGHTDQYVNMWVSRVNKEDCSTDLNNYDFNLTHYAKHQSDGWCVAYLKYSLSKLKLILNELNQVLYVAPLERERIETQERAFAQYAQYMKETKEAKSGEHTKPAKREVIHDVHDTTDADDSKDRKAAKLKMWEDLETLRIVSEQAVQDAMNAKNGTDTFCPYCAQYEETTHMKHEEHKEHENSKENVENAEHADDAENVEKVKKRKFQMCHIM